MAGVVAFTGASVADPVVSLLIGVLILSSSWSILVESVNVLMEGVPKGLDLAALERVVREVPGVLGVHDLHVWTVSSGLVACSCHVVVTEQSVRSGQQMPQEVVDVLRRSFGVTHTTVQVEVEGCEPNEIYCNLRPTGESHPGHRH